MVDTIEVNNFRYTVNEEGDFYICYPIENFEDNFADCYYRDKTESVYYFIENLGLREFNDIEDFIFYFVE